MLGEDPSTRQARGSPTRTRPEQGSAPRVDLTGPGVEGREPQNAGLEPPEGGWELNAGLGEPPAPNLASRAPLHVMGSLRPRFSSLLSSLLCAFPSARRTNTGSAISFP